MRGRLRFIEWVILGFCGALLVLGLTVVVGWFSVLGVP
jgi:hypothetical protein